MGMKPRLAKLAAMVAVGLMALSGCAVNDPNVAATVNGTVLTERQVTVLAEALSNANLAQWEATQEQSQPAASRTPEQQAAYEASLAKQRIELAPGKYRVTVVAVSIQSELAREVAKAKNITVTDAQRQQVISASTGLAAMAADPATKDFIEGYANAYTVFNSTDGLAAGQQAAAAADVSVNPRYGTWTPSQIGLSGTGSLSVSTETSTQQ